MIRTKFIHAGILSIFIGLGIALNADLMPVRRGQFLPSDDEIPFTWHPKLYEIIQFGHVPVAVDWLLIKFLTASEWKHVKPGKRAISYYDLDLATELDPAFFSLYSAGAHFLTVVRNDNEGALQLIEKAEKFRVTQLKKYPKEFQEREWKNAWKIPFLKGFIELFEMHDIEKARQSLSVLNDFPEAPIHLKKLHLKLNTLEGRYEVGERILAGLLQSAKHEDEKKIIQKKQNDFEISKEIALLNQSFLSYLSKKYGPKFQPTHINHNLIESDFRVFLGQKRSSLKIKNESQLFVNLNGKIDTTVKREHVFGLE